MHDDKVNENDNTLTTKQSTVWTLRCKLYYSFTELMAGDAPQQCRSTVWCEAPDKTTRSSSLRITTKFVRNDCHVITATRPFFSCRLDWHFSSHILKQLISYCFLNKATNRGFKKLLFYVCWASNRKASNLFRMRDLSFSEQWLWRLPFSGMWRRVVF
jgi:hypothetical protein